MEFDESSDEQQFHTTTWLRRAAMDLGHYPGYGFHSPPVPHPSPSCLMVWLLGRAFPMLCGGLLLLLLMVNLMMALTMALSTLPTSFLTLRVRLQRSLLSS